MTQLNSGFNYYFQDSILCDTYSIKNYFNLNYGVAFKNLNIDSILYFVSKSTVTFSRGKDMSWRYDNVLLPDVILFINQNEKILNAWFVKEAKKRKVLK